MHNTEKLSVAVPGLEEVSALLTTAGQPTIMMTLAHGAGAGMEHPFMSALAAELANHGIGSLRFNFLYMEKKSKRPDPPGIATKTIEAAIGKTNELFPDLPLVAAGKSFGGRMTSQLLAKENSHDVKGIVFFGFPLHPPGKPSVERAAHLRDVKVPMLFLQGTRDTLADTTLIGQVCAELQGAALISFEGADHSFKVPRSSLIDALALETANWLKTIGL